MNAVVGGTLLATFCVFMGVLMARMSEKPQPEDNLAPIGVMLENGWAIGCYKDTCVYCKGDVVNSVEVMKTCYAAAKEKHGH